MTSQFSSPQLPRPSLADTNRKQRADFADFTSRQNPDTASSFENFIKKQNDERDRQEQDLETTSAKKQKKAAEDAAASSVFTAPPKNTALLASPDLNFMPVASKRLNWNQNSANSGDGGTEKFENGNSLNLKQKSKATSHQGDNNQTTLNLRETNDLKNPDASPEKQTYASLEKLAKSETPHETNTDPSGMENATPELEMISLTSNDAGIQQNSANKLNPVSFAERVMIAPTLSMESHSESSLNQGALTTSIAFSTTMSSKSNRSAEASAVLKNLSFELEKFKQTSKSRMELDLQVSETETVKIRIHLRGNEIRSTFITESPELREALQKSWPEFAQNNRDKGFRFGDPSFQNPYSQNESFAQKRDNQRKAMEEQASPMISAKPLSSRKTTTNESPTSRVSLWA